MKCLSLMQPYAGLVVSGKKTIELRKWNTKFRGAFLVHASRTIDRDACTRFDINPASLTTGAIIGKAVLYDVRKYGSSVEFLSDAGKHLGREDLYPKSKYGFLLKEPEEFRHSIPFKP